MKKNSGKNSLPQMASLKIRMLGQAIGLLGLGLSSSMLSAETIYSDPADLSLKMDRTDGVSIGSNGPNEAANPVGKSGAAAGFDRAAVFVFQLPDLGATEDPFGTASLGLYLFQETVTGAVNGDLYGLGRREFPEVLNDDYYGRSSDPDPTDATLIQDSYLTPEGMTLNSLTATSIDGSAALADYLNLQYEGGAGIGQYVFLRINTDDDTTQRWNFTSVNGAGGDLTQTPQITYLPATAPVETIQVETAVDGSGSTIPSQTLVAGESLPVFSIAREGGVFQDNVPVTWTLSNLSGGVGTGDLMISEDGKSATFVASAPGTAEISIVANATNLIGSGTITVIAGPASAVTVENSSDGFGEPLGDQFLVEGNALTAFAVSRDAGGNFLESVSAVWTLEEVSGAVVAGDLEAAGDGFSATLTGNGLGTARIRATVDGLASIDSGVITVAELISLWDGGGPITNLGIAENWFADLAPAFDQTTDLVFHDPDITRLNPYFGEDRIIRSLGYNADADKNLNLGLTVNGTSGAANLTFDTDSETEPATINVDADASGNFRLGRVTAPDVNEYGSIILADDLLITHNGSGTLNLDGNITEAVDPQNLTKAGTGMVLLSGSNSYTGNTTVLEGILVVKGNSLSDTGSLQIDGGLVDVEGEETVGNLFAGGVRKPAGVYGSSASAAPLENQDDTLFAGFGTVVSLGSAIAGEILQVSEVSFDGTEVTLVWNSSPGETFSIHYSLDLTNFDADIEDGLPAAEVGNATEFSFPISLIGADLKKAFFQVRRE